MRPKERRDSGQNDLFKARLDQIVDLGHPAGEVRRNDRLAVSGGAVRRGLLGQAGPAAAADKADSGAFDPQATCPTKSTRAGSRTRTTSSFCDGMDGCAGRPAGGMR
jgi:hypothetical protein